ncbi:hypothetical protein Godav_003059 [Gossypium davidsonii]|uniref:Large ribosomal subunit protein uL2 C-terminal domain-containing protein n=1 Tax=Gossypium davidsonii TaxID=34287 RepID=A0A7J8SZR8_GOSDV|nr:hypothetical protein [Gossypium davidsonii]
MTFWASSVPARHVFIWSAEHAILSANSLGVCELRPRPSLGSCELDLWPCLENWVLGFVSQARSTSSLCCPPMVHFAPNLLVRPIRVTGTVIHNIEITLGRGGQLARAVGVVVKLIVKEGKSATLKLPSGEVRLISKNCSATVGQVGNVGVNQKILGIAESKCWLSKRPGVRGVVTNPVDHPHGGGEGRAPIGRKKTCNPLGLSCTWKKK